MILENIKIQDLPVKNFPMKSKTNTTKCKRKGKVNTLFLEINLLKVLPQELANG